MPVGVFQPSSSGDWNRLNDLDLWHAWLVNTAKSSWALPRCRARQLRSTTTPGRSYRAPTEGITSGRITGHWLGLGVDPLSFVADVLVAVVIDAEWLDTGFDQIVSTNAEGEVVASDSAGVIGVPFTEERIERLLSESPMQAAGAALLRLAWARRDVLLHSSRS